MSTPGMQHSISNSQRTPSTTRRTTSTPLSIVKEQLQEDDTLLIESDLVFSDRLFPMIL